MKHIFSIFLISLITAGLAVTAYHYYYSINIENTSHLSATNQPITKNITNLGGPVDFTEAAENTVNAVVHVKNLSYVTTRSNSLLEFFYGYRGGTQTQIGTGSGVIISEDGYIVTNNHVIANAAELEVTLNNNETYKAQLIGIDKQMDLALLKINVTEKLPFLTFGNSDQIQLGEWVLAVGNPYNLTSTVTAGIISAKARNLSEGGIQSFIQTDAAINPGNSGGALVNVQGELIGINTMISSTTGSYVGYAFAVPSNVTKKIVEDLLQYGNVQQGVLGVAGFELNKTIAKNLNLSTDKGFYIQSIVKNSDAEKINLKNGDVITSINGKNISSFVDIKNILNTKRPGDSVQITVVSGNQTMDKEIRLIPTTIETFTFKGFEFENLSTPEKNKYNINYGVRIAEMTNQKYQKYHSELANGILLSINSQKVQNVEQVKKLFNTFEKKGSIELEILTTTSKVIKLFL